MEKVFGIDLGTTYSCIAYIDEFGEPVVLKNAEGDLTTPSVVYFESATEQTVGDAAKEHTIMHPLQTVSLIKRMMDKPDYRRNIHGVDMSPAEISSYILKKVVKDAENTLREKEKLGTDEHIRNAVITCPAYFGLTEREATKKAGEIAGLNVLDIINEPTAAAITYGVTKDGQDKTVLVYDLGGGTFDVTMIHIQPGKIEVICTGGDDNLGGRNWDERIMEHIADEYKRGGGPDNILDDIETRQTLSLEVEKAKKLLTTKDKATIKYYYGNKGRYVELTRQKFNELTADLLGRTIDLTKEMFQEAEKKHVRQSDISEILLVGGSSRMPQVADRVKAEFGIEPKMLDPDEAVAKGAAIYASNRTAYNIILEEVAEKTGKSTEELRKQVDDGKVDLEKEAKKVNVSFRGGYLPGDDVKIVNVTSRSFGTEAYKSRDSKELCIVNIILRNASLPATATHTFYPHGDNQSSVLLNVKESLAYDEVIELKDGKDVGQAILSLPEGTTRDTEIEVTFRLDESGLLHLYAKEMQEGREVEAEFQTKGALSEEELSQAIVRSSKSNVN